MNHSEEDKGLMKRCIELSRESVKIGDAPIGALIAKNGKVVFEATNNWRNRVSDHAEIVAFHGAREKLGTSDLSGCVLYTNCEPCPMCAFMAREYRVKKVVFGMASPFMGGYSKWNILEDSELSLFTDFFAKTPEVVGGVLEEEAKKVFEGTPLWMFGSDARSSKKFAELSSNGKNNKK